MGTPGDLASGRIVLEKENGPVTVEKACAKSSRYKSINKICFIIVTHNIPIIFGCGAEGGGHNTGAG